MSKEPDIDEIIENKWLVEFNRKPFDKFKDYGFVLACNDDFTVIQILDKTLYQMDGYCVFQNKSVKTFRVYDKEEYYLNEVVKLKRLEPKPIPQILIESWETILQTVNDNFNLVGIESELIYKNQLNIGRLKEIGKKKFSLIEIDPEAEWDDSPTKYEYKHLTRVSFDCPYINTLWEVSESRNEKIKVSKKSAEKSSPPRKAK